MGILQETLKKDLSLTLDSNAILISFPDAWPRRPLWRPTFRHRPGSCPFLGSNSLGNERSPEVRHCLREIGQRNRQNAKSPVKIGPDFGNAGRLQSSLLRLIGIGWQIKFLIAMGRRENCPKDDSFGLILQFILSERFHYREFNSRPRNTEGRAADKASCSCHLWWADGTFWGSRNWEKIFAFLTSFFFLFQSDLMISMSGRKIWSCFQFQSQSQRWQILQNLEPLPFFERKSFAAKI